MHCVDLHKGLRILLILMVGSGRSIKVLEV
jgi:hypothetical protein